VLTPLCCCERLTPAFSCEPDIEIVPVFVFGLSAPLAIPPGNFFSPPSSTHVARPGFFPLDPRQVREGDGGLLCTSPCFGSRTSVFFVYHTRPPSPRGPGHSLVLNLIFFSSSLHSTQGPKVSCCTGVYDGTPPLILLGRLGFCLP